MDKYSDAQISELDEFARAVIEAWSPDDRRQLYASTSRVAYQQYLAEVYFDISGMAHDPRLFFESDLGMRRAWGDQIASDLARYKAVMLKESAEPTEQPDTVKELRGELEALKTAIAKFTPAPASEVPSTEGGGEES